VTLQADLGGLRAQNDAMSVTARFRDGSGIELGSIAVGPVTAIDRGNVTQLLRRTASGLIPPGTRSIEVVLTATRVSGTYNNAMADNVKLFLGLPPSSAPPPGDDVAPALTLSGRKRQRLDRAIELGALCDEACAVALGGRLVVITRKRGTGGREAKRRRTFQLATATRDLNAGETTTLKLRLRRGIRRSATRALRQGGRVRASITASASDASGNSATATRAIRLRRKR
jgi:hypothetical protein